MHDRSIVGSANCSTSMTKRNEIRIGGSGVKEKNGGKEESDLNELDSLLMRVQAKV